MSLTRIQAGSTKLFVALLGALLCACHGGSIRGRFEQDCSTPACRSERASDDSVIEDARVDGDAAFEPMASADARIGEGAARTNDASQSDAGAWPKSDASGGPGDASTGRADASAEEGGLRIDGGKNVDGGLPFPTSVAAGAHHTCALFSDGSGRCWGYNHFGQLGNGTATGISPCVNNTAMVVCSRRPVPIVGLARAVSISLGDNHSCAVLSGGALQCWGLNEPIAGITGRRRVLHPAPSAVSAAVGPCGGTCCVYVASAHV